MLDQNLAQANWRSIAKVVVPTAAVAGTLDLISAMAYMAADGRNALAVPIGIATAIWPSAKLHVLPAIVMGIVLHYLIMAVMVAAFAVIVNKSPRLGAHPYISGALYGLFLWLVMYFMVLPLRWPGIFPVLAIKPVIEQLFSHVILVGVVMSVCVTRLIRAAG